MKFGENRHFMKTLLGICHAFVRTAQRSLPVLQQIKVIEFGLIGLRPNGNAMHNSLIGYVLRTSAADCLYAGDSRAMCEAFRLVSCVSVCPFFERKTVKGIKLSDCTDSSDCLRTRLSIYVFYFFVLLFPTY